MSSIRNRRLLIAASILAMFLTNTVSHAAAGQEDSAQSGTAALAMEQRGQIADAERAWNAILRGDPGNTEALAHMGLLEARQEHYGVAIDFYKRAIAIDPNFPGLQMNLGLALFKAGQFPDSIRTFTAEIRRHPGDRRLTILLGMAHYAMKDFLVAIPYLQQALGEDTANVSLHVALARSCLMSKQYQCVVDEHDALLASHSDPPEMDLLTASALQALNRPEEGIRELKTAVQSNSSEPRLHFALGFLLWSTGKWQEAADEFQLDLQGNPQDVMGHVILGDCRLRERQTPKALGELEGVEAGDEWDGLRHLDLAIIYLDSNRKEDSLREIKTAAESDPDDAELHRRIAELYQSVGRESEAKKEFDSAQKMTEVRPSLQEMLELATP